MTTLMKINPTHPKQKIKAKGAPRGTNGEKKTLKNPSSITVTPGASHKKINNTSVNRRLCTRIDEVDTQDHNLSNFQHDNLTRVTLKLTIPASKDPTKATLERILDFLKNLFSSDNSAALIPWYKHDKQEGSINTKSPSLSTIKQAKIYLNRLWNVNPGEKRTLYPNLYIGHQISLDEIRSDMKDWLWTGNHNIFRNMLQVEKTSSIGWFCYSTREMDAGALADEIEDLLNIKVGLRWKMISTGNTKTKIPDKEKVNALEIEVDRNCRDLAQRKLLKFYSRSTKESRAYPNGIRLRFVKPFSEAVSTSERSKINLLRQRQA